MAKRCGRPEDGVRLSMRRLTNRANKPFCAFGNGCSGEWDNAGQLVSQTASTPTSARRAGPRKRESKKKAGLTYRLDRRPRNKRLLPPVWCQLVRLQSRSASRSVDRADLDIYDHERRQEQIRRRSAAIYRGNQHAAIRLQER